LSGASDAPPVIAPVITRVITRVIVRVPASG
jgi:hypothetical protein